MLGGRGTGAGRTGARALVCDFSVNVKSFQNKTFNWKKSQMRSQSLGDGAGAPRGAAQRFPAWGRRAPVRPTSPPPRTRTGCGQGRCVWRLPRGPPPGSSLASRLLGRLLGHSKNPGQSCTPHKILRSRRGRSRRLPGPFCWGGRGHGQGSRAPALPAGSVGQRCGILLGAYQWPWP